MTTTTTTLIKELRTRTGAGIVDAKRALEEAQNDVEQAIVILRKKGQASAAKKAGRATREGIIGSYVHGNGKVASIVALQCESDFVARNDKFKELARNIALHIAATDPTVIRPEDIDPATLEAEKVIALTQAKAAGKPANIQEKMVAGKLKTFSEETALLTQPFIKDPKHTVGDLITAAISELGENISVTEFKRIAI